MPRLPRQKSESGIYHIMLRGINQQAIFEDNEDYFKFVETLEQKKRDECIRKLKDKGLSIRQISRLTGISFSIVRKL